MKQLGLTLIIMGLWTTLCLFLNLTGVLWDILNLISWLLALFFTPNLKAILVLKLHWRIVIALAALSGFVTVWETVKLITPFSLQAYSFPITIFIFGMLAIFLHFLDLRKYHKNQAQ